MPLAIFRSMISRSRAAGLHLKALEFFSSPVGIGQKDEFHGKRSSNNGIKVIFQYMEQICHGSDGMLRYDPAGHGLLFSPISPSELKRYFMRWNISRFCSLIGRFSKVSINVLQSVTVERNDAE